MPSFLFYSNPQTTAEKIQNAIQLALASEWSYHNKVSVRKKVKKEWGLEAWPFEEGETQGFVVSDHEKVIVAFRGTEKKLKDWLTDARFIKQDSPTGGRIHSGFSDALELVYARIVGHLFGEKILTESKQLWVTGHSLGAALATLFSARLYFERKIRPTGIFTFGSPRVGNPSFAAWFNEQMKPAFSCRFDNNSDPVPLLPPVHLFDFEHIQKRFYFDEEGRMEQIDNRFRASETKKGLSEARAFDAVKRELKGPLVYLGREPLEGKSTALGFQARKNLFQTIGATVFGWALKALYFPVYWGLRIFLEINIDDHSLQAYLDVLRKNQNELEGKKAGPSLRGKVRNFSGRVIRIFQPK